MTRINVGVEPCELPDKLLLAEHREITRIPNNIRNGRAVVKDIPRNFCLGVGHMKFFYNKLLYLRNRYNALYDECCRRGFNVASKHLSFVNLPESLMNDYQETKQDRHIIQQRIESKGFRLQNRR